MAYFNTIKINGVEIIRPNDFTPERTDLYAGEIKTLTGSKKADLVGWQYADMTMQWDALPEEHLHVLLSMSGVCKFEFEDADGLQHTENIRRISEVTTATRVNGPDGAPLWKNVNVAISFMDAHK